MNDTEKNLLAAFQDYKDTGPIQYTYRVYYDPKTGDCTYTDVVLRDDPFVEVDKETFTNFNPIFYRVVDGKIKSRQIDYSDKRILVIGTGPYTTIKGAGMFLVKQSTDAETIQWRINDDN